MENLKSILLIPLLLFVSSISFTQVTEKSFPTNFNSKTFKKPDKYVSEIIAYDGTIKEIQTSKNNTPFYKIDLGNNKILWTVLMFANPENKVGDKIRLIGYLNKIDHNLDSEKYLKSHDYMVIALGLVDFQKGNYFFVGAGSKQKEQWLSGQIPQKGN